MTSEPRVLIGLHVSSESGVTETIAAIHEATAERFELVVLADPEANPDPSAVPSLSSALHPRRGARILQVPAPGGAPAAFNHLVANPADVYVFLESDVRPGRGWLGKLLQALASTKCGLVGPATNRGWNEQASAMNCDGSSASVAAAGELLSRAHPGPSIPLTPLHSLLDFCFVVSAEVVNRVGAADLAYKRGPCWEMDYSLRAARAGFIGRWVPGAFVYRAPIPPNRRVVEEQLLERNKGLYQARFCRRQLLAPEGNKPPFESTCRGESCADFAPSSLVRLHLPLIRNSKGQGNHVSDDLPLVSAVMPTRGRPAFVARSIEYFRRQDYPRRELVIVYESDEDLPADAAAPDVHLVRTEQKSIGGKRNAGTHAASGDIIAQWDDDDWHGPERLSFQVNPILQGVADVTGLSDLLFAELSAPAAARPARFWEVTPALFRRLFFENVAGGTLVFARRVWKDAGRYPSASLREDADFLGMAIRRGARLVRLPGRAHYVYIRHGHNTWRFTEGHHIERGGWRTIEPPQHLARDFALPSRAAGHATGAEPLLSCIMPTANRRLFVSRAVNDFLAQDYAARELIVLDDGEDSVADLIPPHPLIRYQRLPARLTLGDKRNLACEMANGELIAHWDDDDWRAPNWLTSQVSTLSERGADLCGLDRVFFYAPAIRKAWRYSYDGGRPWVAGGTLCYTRTLWQRHRFQPVNVGEDNAFVWGAKDARLAINPQNGLYVATVHDRNTSPKATDSQRWRSVPAAHVEQLMSWPLSVAVGSHP